MTKKNRKAIGRTEHKSDDFLNVQKLSSDFFFKSAEP